MSDIRIGMVGLDTSHCEAFVSVLNYEDNPHFVGGARVVGAYPGGSELCAVSRDRVEGFTQTIRDKHGIAICDTIEGLGEDMDAFLLHSVDGRQHLEQFRVLAQFGKPVFMDKPLACSFADAKQIGEIAARGNVPVMSASSIRFSAGVTNLAAPGDEVGSCEAFGTMPILDDYPTYFWYGVHGADLLFSYMGRGCRTVQAVHSEDMDLLVGVWEDGRVGTVRGTRFSDYHFGCTLFCKSGTVHGRAADEPPAHAIMLKDIIRFFQSGASSIPIEETLEVMAFLDAAGQSLAAGGKRVPLPR
ncbi:MAG: Gfo/Idh/MocA family oxidoreductase [Candidatus Brocadiae bacterium]|nr:Gfo/Idh/MocA family oxidoreductase [Candidatus Brocadiia bacterium]